MTPKRSGTQSNRATPESTKRSDKIKMKNGSSIEGFGSGEPLRGAHPERFKEMNERSKTHSSPVTPESTTGSECACEIVGDGNHPATIRHCPLHKAAPLLVEALAAIESEAAHPYGQESSVWEQLTAIQKIAQAALREAKEGRTQNQKLRGT